MASYTYYNQTGFKYTTDIRDGWHRLNHCNAQYQHLKREGFEYWNLISYATPICRVAHITHNGHDSWHMDVSSYYDYSPTTIRQLQKFLAMFNLPFTFSDIREQELIDKGMVTNEPVMSVTFRSVNELEGYFRSNACQRNSYPCEIL